MLPIELRSDTFTKPTPAMRRAMAEAEVGDDVYSEDPTLNRLESRAAEVFAREAALFVPSGSMGNLLAIQTWAQPSREIICELRAHVNEYEISSMSVVAGCFPRAIPAPDGFLDWERIEPQLRTRSIHNSETGLICLENTHNMHGGTVLPQTVADDVCAQAHAHNLRVHLDGARIFNAAVASGRSVAEITKPFDSVMFCLSKGLGAPVGSMLVGPREFIDRARIGRKLLGGGMRQAGILAAAGLIALEETPKILHVDHANAKHLARGLAKISGLVLDPEKVVTNIVIFDCHATGLNAIEFCERLAPLGVLATDTAKFSVRMVTHYDVSRAQIDRALQILPEFIAALPNARKPSASTSHAS